MKNRLVSICLFSHVFFLMQADIDEETVQRGIDALNGELYEGRRRIITFTSSLSRFSCPSSLLSHHIHAFMDSVFYLNPYSQHIQPSSCAQ